MTATEAIINLYALVRRSDDVLEATLGGEWYTHPATPEPPARQWLASLLYRHCYCRGYSVQAWQLPVPQPDDPNTQAAFVAAIRSMQPAGVLTEDTGWQCLEQDARYITCRKNRTTRRFLKEQCRPLGMPAGPEGSFPVAVSRQRNQHAPGDPFFFVFGANIEFNPAVLCRFYIDAHPAVVPQLMAGLVQKLDAYGLPFQAKCLTYPALYASRADNVVVYIDQRHAALCGELLAALLQELPEDGRVKRHPLFTLRVGEGLGFAESPPGGESFGMNRCLLLAHLMLNNEPGLSPEQIAGLLARYGFKDGTLYHNPGVRPVYPFANNEKA